jgi:hypothetical protein
MPLPWVLQNPDPDLYDIPDAVLERLCAASNMDNGDDQANSSLLLWTMTLADRHGQRLEELSDDEVMLWGNTVAVQLHTEWLRRRGLVVTPRGGFLGPTEPLPAELPFDTILIRP